MKSPEKKSNTIGCQSSAFLFRGRLTVETNATDIVATLNRPSNRTHRGSPGGRCNGEFRFRTNA